VLLAPSALCFVLSPSHVVTPPPDESAISLTLEPASDQLLVVTAGTDLSITCHTDNAATLVWTFNGGILPRYSAVQTPSERVSILTLPTVEEKSAGIYACLGHSPSGFYSDAVAIEVEVYGKKCIIMYMYVHVDVQSCDCVVYPVPYPMLCSLSYSVLEPYQAITPICTSICSCLYIYNFCVYTNQILFSPLPIFFLVLLDSSYTIQIQLKTSTSHSLLWSPLSSWVRVSLSLARWKRLGSSAGGLMMALCQLMQTSYRPPPSCLCSQSIQQ